MKTVSFRALLCWLFAGPVFAQTTGAPQQFYLPKGLAEISGLTMASEKTVYGHNDEFAIVYEIDFETGDVIGAFALGDPTIPGDFEGIAMSGGRMYLITSDGKLYESDIGENRTRVRFNVYDTGAGASCEIEGLTEGAAPGEFLILCKRPRKKTARNRLTIYRWSLEDRRPVTAPAYEIGLKEAAGGSEREEFRPAGLIRNAETSELLVVSSRSRMVYVFDDNGVFRRKHRLPKSVHAQPEGIALTASGSVLIADEGGKRGAPGTLSVYRALP